jgi:hypothetical protein
LEKLSQEMQRKIEKLKIEMEGNFMEFSKEDHGHKYSANLLLAHQLFKNFI